MVGTIFIVGLLTSVGAGLQFTTCAGTWKHFAMWALTGFGGAGLMVLAFLLQTGWRP